jgi:hypothetical protein
MRRFAALFSLAAMLLVPAAASAQITYNLNRTIGGGSVFGTVTTDGTIGVLSATNFRSWTLTLTSPNLNASGGTEVITGTSTSAGVLGSALVATPTALTFDFGGFGAIFALQGASSNAWCLSNAGLTCVGEAPQSESIFFRLNGGPAETVSRSGVETLGTAAAQVPEPSTASLLLLAVAGMGVAARRRSYAA